MKTTQMILPVLGLALLAGAGCATAPFADGPATALTACNRLGRGSSTVLLPPEKRLAGLVSPKAMTGKLAMAGKSVSLAIDARTEGGELAVLRLDLAGKGDFQAATVIELQVPKANQPAGASPMHFFNYQAALPGTAGHPLYLTGNLSPAFMIDKATGKADKEVFFVNQLCAEVRSGMVTIAGTPRAVALVDADGNGLFNDADGIEKVKDQTVRRGDVVLVDSGKGDFSDPATLRLVVLNHLLDVDGKFYAFQVDPMGKSAKAGLAKVAFGKLRFEAGGMNLTGALAGSLTDVAVTSAAEKPVPADKYQIGRLQIVDPASKARIILGRLPPVEVLPGQTLTVPVYSSLECRIAAAPMNDKREVILSAKLATGTGQPVAYVYDQAGKMASIGLEIRDADGKKIHQGNFQYG
jgi:hypothetical protein